jgi:hypothetical protein
MRTRQARENGPARLQNGEKAIAINSLDRSRTTLSCLGMRRLRPALERDRCDEGGNSCLSGGSRRCGLYILSFQVLTRNFAECKGTVYFDASLARERLPDLRYRRQAHEKISPTCGFTRSTAGLIATTHSPSDPANQRICRTPQPSDILSDMEHHAPDHAPGQYPVRAIRRRTVRSGSRCFLPLNDCNC